MSLKSVLQIDDLHALFIPRRIGDCAIVPTPVHTLKSFIQAGL